MFPEHVMMEIERRLCDTNHAERSIATVAHDIGFGEDTDMSIPNDGMAVAIGLDPMDPEGHVHRGVIPLVPSTVPITPPAIKAKASGQSSMPEAA
jgi:hypothetical protein